MARQYSQKYKEHAVKYYLANKNLGITRCAKNIGISKSVLSEWYKIYSANNGEVPTRGRGNFSNDIAKDNARLRKELQDTYDSVEILKRASSSEKLCTSNLFSSLYNYEIEIFKIENRRLNVSGVLRILGISRSGYNSWKSRCNIDS